VQVPLDELERMTEDPSTGELVTLPGINVETLFLNFADPRAEPDERRSEPDTRHPLLSDRRIRQAIGYAIPREPLAELYGNRFGEPFGHPLAFPEEFRGSGAPIDYDLAKARALLAEAGFDGGTLLIQTSVNAVRQQTQEIIARALEELGFTVELKSVDAGVFFSRDRENPDTYGHFYADMQFYSYGSASPYPLEWAERFRSDRIASAANGWSEPNISRYVNPEFDRLHDQARVEMHPERQAELWRRMMNILTDDVVVIPLLRRNSLAAVSNRVNPAGFSPWAVAPSWNLQHWTLSE
jgi:peptide/nickel transport system substrate-binding protein